MFKVSKINRYQIALILIFIFVNKNLLYLFNDFTMHLYRDFNT